MPAPRLRVDSTATGASALLIGLDAAGPVVWAAGARGTWARSLDGGRTWTHGAVPGADTLQFRDVHAFDARRAVLLSIGNGTASRVYTTDDGGASWALRWTNPDPRAFYDCMAFDGQSGFAFSDAVPVEADRPQGAHQIPRIVTSDGGNSWRVAAETDPGRLSSVLPGTGAFASSGTCAVMLDGRWVMAYNEVREDGRYAVVAEDLREPPVWAAATLVVTQREMDGVSTLASAGGVLYAGLLGSPDSVGVYRSTRRAPLPEWQALPPLPIARVYGLAASPKALVATGPDGLAASLDQGQTWRHLTRADLWSATRVDDRTFVAVGRDGRAFRIRVE